MTRSAAGFIDEALRVTGRLVALAVVSAFIFFLFGVALKPVFPEGLPVGADGRQLYLLLLAAALAVAQMIFVAVAEKGDWADSGIGPSGWSPPWLAGGFAIGVAIPLVSAVVGALTGINGAPLISWVWPTTGVLMLTLTGTLVDALLLRGYVIGVIATRLGEITAVSITALIATLLAVRVEAPTPMVAVGAFALAMCLGLLRLRTGSFAAAWLAHLGAATVLDGLGGDAVPGLTAGLLIVVSFLLYRMRRRTSRPGRV